MLDRESGAFLGRCGLKHWPRFEETEPGWALPTPQAAAEYAALKRDLAQRFADDREAYTDAKAEFIRRTLGER